MPPLIPQLTYGKVVGFFFVMIGDGTDPDALPEQVPVNGKATFTLPFKSVTVKGVGIGISSQITVDIKDGNLMDGTNMGVRLIANDMPGASQTSYTTDVSFQDLHYTDLTGTLVRTSLDSFPILVPTWHDGDNPVDLSDYVPIQRSVGTTIIRGPEGEQGPIGGTAPIDDTTATSGNIWSAAKTAAVVGNINPADTTARMAASNAQTSADSKYTKPSSGIPAADLAAPVQAQLTNPIDATARSNAAAAYVRPGTGIPSTDLAPAVQAQLSSPADATARSAAATAQTTANGKYTKPAGGITAADLVGTDLPVSVAQQAAINTSPIVCAWNGTAWATITGTAVPTAATRVRYYDSTGYTTGVTAPTWYNPLDKWFGSS